MTWARIDDGLYDDPRVTAAGLDAMGLYVLAASYMGRYNTDGAIDRARVKRLAGRRGAPLAARLVAAGLWEATGEGWQLIAWDGVLVPREEVARRSAGARVAGAKGGRVRAERAAHHEPEPTMPDDLERTPEISPTYPRDNPADISPVQSAKSAKEKRTGQPTPAHVPEPEPVPDSAQARTHAGSQQGESGGGGGGQRGPSFADLCDPPGVDRSRDLAGSVTASSTPGSLQNKGQSPDHLGTDLPRPNPSPRAPAGASPSAPPDRWVDTVACFPGFSAPAWAAECPIGDLAPRQDAAPSQPVPQRPQLAPPAGASPALPGLGVELAPEPKATRPKRRAEVDLPQAWGPKPDHFALGASVGLNRDRVTFEAAKFQDFHGAKGSRFVDWEAAFRTWLRNASTFGAQRGGPPPAPLPPPRPPIIQEAHLRGPPPGAANKPASVVRGAAILAARRAAGGPPVDPEKALAELCDILAPARKQRAS